MCAGWASKNKFHGFSCENEKHISSLSFLSCSCLSLHWVVGKSFPFSNENDTLWCCCSEDGEWLCSFSSSPHSEMTESLWIIINKIMMRWKRKQAVESEEEKYEN